MRRLFAIVFAMALLAGELPRGWHLEQEMEFSRENLYKYLDGGADRFLNSGFLKLRVYFLKKGEREAVAEIYAFEKEEDALRFFKEEEGKPCKIGDGGKLQPNGLVFVSGKRLFKIYTYRVWKGLNNELLSLGKYYLRLNQGAVRIKTKERSGR